MSREIIESEKAIAKLVEWIWTQDDTGGHGRRSFLDPVKEARLDQIIDAALP